MLGLISDRLNNNIRCIKIGCIFMEILILSKKEELLQLIEILSDDKIGYVLAYAQCIIANDYKFDPFYSRENMTELKRRIDDVKSGKNKLKERDLIEVE